MARRRRRRLTSRSPVGYRKRPHDARTDFAVGDCRRVRNAGVQGDHRPATGSSEGGVRDAEPPRRKGTVRRETGSRGGGSDRRCRHSGGHRSRIAAGGPSGVPEHRRGGHRRGPGGHRGDRSLRVGSPLQLPGAGVPAGGRHEPSPVPRRVQRDAPRAGACRQPVGKRRGHRMGGGRPRSRPDRRNRRRGRASRSARRTRHAGAGTTAPRTSSSARRPAPACGRRAVRTERGNGGYLSAMPAPGREVPGDLPDGIPRQPAVSRARLRSATDGSAVSGGEPADRGPGAAGSVRARG